MTDPIIKQQEVRIQAGQALLEGNLALPEGARGIGSSRFSPRNRFVAAQLFKAGIGSLLIDLLTPREDADYQTRFDIPLLTTRLMAASTWLQQYPSTYLLSI